ncbi:MAG: ferredoxin family protein [Thermoguttaceae bacterium]|nr:ferredoxin family protein [Thermoguttaceae bacterium]
MTGVIRILFSRPRQFDSLVALLEEAIVREFSGAAETSVQVMPHLYDLPPEAPLWDELATASEHLVVLCALYPRATYWVLRAHGVDGQWVQTSSWHEEDLPERPREGAASSAPETSAEMVERPSASPQRFIWCFDVRDFQSAESAVGQIRQLLAEVTSQVSPAFAQNPGSPVGGHSSDKARDTAHQTRAAAGAQLKHELQVPFRPRWYPVIDYSRCRNCLQCLNFCLFGVYHVDGLGKLMVRMPDACRDGCPACARICPSGAIIFPMYPDPVIAGGAPPKGNISPSLPSLPILPGNAQVWGEISRAGRLPSVKPATDNPTASAEKAPENGQVSNEATEGARPDDASLGTKPKLDQLVRDIEDWVDE